MPIYEYRCECGKEFESKVSIRLRHEVHCSECGRLARKKVSVCNFAMAMRWPEDRREHFAREFEKRRCERPKRYG